MSKEQGLFAVDNVYYTLKLNMKKVEQIETMLGVSFVAEVAKTGGMISFNLLSALFSVGLYDIEDEKAVKGNKARDIYYSLVENEGYSKVAEVAIAKIEEDLGFLFQ